MKSRMSTIALAWGVMLFVSFNNMLRPFNSILDVFVWMGYLLIIAVILLWPKTGKNNRIEEEARGNWAARVDFDAHRNTTN